jgi:allophanate hydrolase
MVPQKFTIDELLTGYAAGNFTPTQIMEAVRKRIKDASDNPIWITVLDDAQIQSYLDKLPAKPNEALPLYGIPFAIKDNIDLAGIPTTAACPDFAYTPEKSAFAVQRLIDAGAIPVGKTNLDQFATGLVGTRSPHGACRNAIDPTYISGGSSSGSAVAVALNQVCFSLGTDTAGSGRVPASLNRLVGLKPTKGRVSTSGVVPACRSLDCVSIFAHNSRDASSVLEILDVFDADDCYSRIGPMPKRAHLGIKPFRCGVPKSDQLAFFGDEEGPSLFRQAIEKMKSIGAEIHEVDLQPFLDAANLLYGGPWVAERYIAVESIIEEHPEWLHPVTRGIIEGGKDIKATDTFRALYALENYKRAAEGVWSEVDMILTPTIGRPFTIEEVESDPVQKNTDLGYYTNFMNLLNLSALAVPAGSYARGFPYGVTLIAKAFEDAFLLDLGRRLEGAPPTEPPVDGYIPIAVCGAHLDGLPLNADLRALGAVLDLATTTTPSYRLYALPGTQPPKPALIRVPKDGYKIEIEIWKLPSEAVGEFLKLIPPPLGLGTVECDDGRLVKGFIAEPMALEGACDISDFGGWRNYLTSLG